MVRPNCSPQLLNEFSAIGAFLISYNSDAQAAGETRIGMMDLLRPEMFQDPAHREIWKALRVSVLDGENPDLVLLASRLRSNGMLAEVGGAEYLARLVEETPTWSNGLAYAKNVAVYWKRRTVASALQRVAKDVEAIPDGDEFDPMAILDKAFRAVCESADAPTVALLMSFLEEGLQMRPVLETPIVTRIAKLDGNINLFTPGELTILAARPSVGKSSFARQICANASTKGDILIFSMEVAPKILALQFACEMAGVPFSTYTKGALSDDQILKVMRSDEDPNLKRIHVYKGPQPSAIDVAMALTNLKVRGREVAAVVIDYLGLMRHPKSERHDIAVGDTTRSLKQLAIQRNVPIILLCQLNRAVEQRGGASECDRPRLNDLRDSGNIEQDADNVVFLWRRERDDQYKAVEARTLTVAKHRNGQVFEIDLMFDKAAGKFYEAPSVVEEQVPPPSRGGWRGDE